MMVNKKTISIETISIDKKDVTYAFKSSFLTNSLLTGFVVRLESIWSLSFASPFSKTASPFTEELTLDFNGDEVAVFVPPTTLVASSSVFFNSVSRCFSSSSWRRNFSFSSFSLSFYYQYFTL